MEDSVRKRMHMCMCHWVPLLYSRKLTEHCKAAIPEKIKIIFKNKKNEKELFITAEGIILAFLGQNQSKILSLEVQTYV